MGATSHVALEKRVLAKNEALIRSAKSTMKKDQDKTVTDGQAEAALDLKTCFNETDESYAYSDSKVVLRLHYVLHFKIPRRIRSSDDKIDIVGLRV